MISYSLIKIVHPCHKWQDFTFPLWWHLLPGCNGTSSFSSPIMVWVKKLNTFDAKSIITCRKKLKMQSKKCQLHVTLLNRPLLCNPCLFMIPTNSVTKCYSGRIKQKVIIYAYLFSWLYLSGCLWTPLSLLNTQKKNMKC